MIHTFLLAFLLLTPLAFGDVRAGVAREEFALPTGVPLAGYSRRDGKPSRGTHDPVGVRALVVEDGETVVAVVSCDLLIIDERLRDAVDGRLRAALPSAEVPALLVAATHTHSGPGAYGSRFFEKLSMGHFDADVFEALIRAITQAVARAHADCRPARMLYRSGSTSGLVANRMDPAGVVDEELVVVGFYPMDQPEPFAILVNFSAHATMLGAWNLELSADYPGVVTRELERRFPSATALFVAGAVGDQAPVKSGERFEPMERLGQALARQAAALLDHGGPAAVQQLRVREERMPLPPAAVRLGGVRIPRWLGRALVDDDATLSVLAIDRTVFIGVPCDLAASFGARLKATARDHGLNPVIAGFANDYIGYCVPASLYTSDAYEASLAFNGPKAGERIVERLIQLLAEVGTHAP